MLTVLYITTFIVKHVSTNHESPALNCNCSSAVATLASDQDGGGGGGLCSCVEELREIRCDNLSQVPTFSAAVNCLLAGVYMAKQSIRQIRADAFSYVTTRRLVLNFNDIGDRLDVAAFRGNLSKFLRELYLGACRLRILPVGLFDNMSNLVVLHLWHNRLQHVPGAVFVSCCANLRELILSNNHISSLHPHTFARLHNLRKLDLDFNEISKLSRELFTGLDSLRVYNF